MLKIPKNIKNQQNKHKICFSIKILIEILTLLVIIINKSLSTKCTLQRGMYILLFLTSNTHVFIFTIIIQCLYSSVHSWRSSTHWMIWGTSWMERMCWSWTSGWGSSHNVTNFVVRIYYFIYFLYFFFILFWNISQAKFF